MKSTLFFAFLLLARLEAGAQTPYTDVTAAATSGQALVTARANGLGTENLTCTFTNLSGKELRLRVPPGLHFKASDSGAQDLLTYQQVLLVLAPTESKQARLRGFCIEHHDYAPHNNLVYALNGPAGKGLKPLADSLYRYPELAEGYGQMFVWAISDRYPMYDVGIKPAHKRGATNIMRYITSVTGLPANKIVVSADARPTVRTFTKRVVMLYHSPSAQVASLKVFGANNRLVSELFSNRKLAPGVVRYTYGVNAMVRLTETPVFYVRLLGANDQVLKEIKIDDNTAEPNAEPATRKFAFEFKLAKPVKNAYFRVRLRDGALVEDVAKEAYLPAGGFRFNMGFHHLYPAGTKFVARLETEDGKVLAEQAIAEE